MPATAVLESLKPPALLRAQVVQQIRAAILDGRYPPGTRLIERELCDTLAVSRTSVREALRQLEAEQLVAALPRRGPVVATISAQEAAQIYELRALLEGFAARNFIRNAGPAHRAALDRLARQFAGAARRGMRAELVASMSGFYDTLFAGAGNAVLHGMSAQLMARVSFLRATSMSEPGRVAYSLAEIGAIISAIAQGNADAAERAAVHHVREAERAALRQLAGGARKTARPKRAVA